MKSLDVRRCILRVLTCCVVLIGALLHAGPGDFDPNARPQFFNRSEEFPNFFLPPAYRKVPADQVPAEVVAASRAKMEQALASVFKRLTIPIVPEGESGVRQVRYFEYVQGQVGNDVHVMPSGGVVRSSIGYLYNEIYDGMNKVPPLSPEQVLERIINDKNDLPGFSIRGIGSDFDVLVKGSPKAMDRAIEIITKITNSAETHYGARETDGMKRALFTVGDVKKYDDQIGLSTRQGGATVDFLAYDLKDGRIVEPADHDYIVSDLLRGQYRYIPPTAGETIKDTDKQTVRGVRSLVELPFLELRDGTRLRTELQTLINKLKKGELLTAKSIEQFDRIIRNARFGGAHNRIYRGQSGSIESLLLQLNDLIRQNRQHRGIPEFVDSFIIEKRNAITKSELNGVPRELLMGMGKFVEQYTDKGVLYHGTPDLDFAMAIMRGGLFISGGRNAQGMAVYGRGGYSSWLHSFSLGYAGKDGLVFHLPVKQSEKLNILDLGTHGQHPAIEAIRKKALAEGKDFHEVLAREHGIDIIVNGHVLLQNLQAVELPKDPGILMHGLYSVIQNSNSDPLARWKAFVEYRRFFPYAQGVGLSDAPAPPDATEVMKLLHGSLTLAQKEVEGADQRLTSVLSRIHLAQPELYGKKEHPFWLRASIYGNIDYETIQRVDDKEMRQELQTVRTEIARAKEVRDVLSSLAKEAPLSFIEVFPDSNRVVDVSSGALEVTTNGIVLSKGVTKFSHWEQALIDVSAHTRLGQELSSQDQSIIRYLIRHASDRSQSEAVRWIEALLAQSAPKHAEFIIAEMKHAGENGMLTAARLVEGGKSAEGQRARDLLRAALGKDRAWGDKVKDLYLQPPTRYYAQGFPWNLKDRGDLKRVAEIGRADAPELAEESAAVAKELRDRYGLYENLHGFKNDLRTLVTAIDHISLEAIPDPALRERARSVRTQRTLSRAGENLRRAIAERDPVKAKHLFNGFTLKSATKAPYFADAKNQGFRILNRVEKEGKKGLTAEEHRHIRDSLAAPLQHALKSFYEALLQSPDMAQLAINRLRKPLDGDDAQFILEVVGSSQTHRPVLSAIAREQAAEIKASISCDKLTYDEYQHLIWFPWDLTTDRQTLLDLHKNLAPPKDLDRRWRTAILDILQAQPAVITEDKQHYLLTNFSHRWHPVSHASAIDDPILRQRFADLEREKENLKYIQSLMLFLAEKYPLQMLLQYPQYDYSAQKGFNLELNSDGISKHPNRKQTTDLEDAVLGLAENLHAGRALSVEQIAILDYFIRHGGSHEKMYKGLAALLSNASEVGRKEVFARLKLAGEAGQASALKVLSVSKEFPAARNHIVSELGRDRAWRSQVRSRIPAFDGHYSRVGYFPWNLADSGDRELLAQGLRIDVNALETELNAMIRLLRDRYALVGSNGERDLVTLERYKFEVRPEMIPDPALRARYEKAISEYLSGLRVREKLSELSRQNPSGVEKAFPGFVPNALRLTNGQRPNHYPLRNHLTEKGFEGLAADQVRVVRQFLQSPIQEDQREMLVAMLKSQHEKPRAAALARLRAFKSGDSAATVLEIAGELRNLPVRAEVNKVLEQPELRAELFAFARSTDPIEPSQIDKLDNYPWDLERDADIIETLFAKQANHADLQKAWRQIHGKIAAEQPELLEIQGRNSHFFFSGGSIHDTPLSSGEYIDDPQLRKEFRKVQARRSVYLGVESLLTHIATTSPLAFSHRFPHIKSAFRWQSTAIEVKPDGSIQPISEKSKPSELEKMIVVVSQQTRSSGRLSQAHKDLLRYLFRHLATGGGKEIEYATALLAHADEKSTAKLWKIFEELTPPRPEVLLEFLYKENTKNKATAFLQAHPQFRPGLREAALRPDSYRMSTYPWDVTDEGDLKALEKFAAVSLEENARQMDDVLLELRSRYQLAYAPHTEARSDLASLREGIEYLKPDFIPDENLRERFRHLKAEKRETEAAWRALAPHSIDATVVKLAVESRNFRNGPAPVTPENLLMVRQLMASNNPTLSAHGRHVVQEWLADKSQRAAIATFMQQRGIHLLPGHFTEESIGLELDRYSAQVDKCVEWIRELGARTGNS